MTEFVDNIDFRKLVKCVSKYIPHKNLSSGVDKQSLQLMCELASSEKDRTLIRVAHAVKESQETRQRQ